MQYHYFTILGQLYCQREWESIYVKIFRLFMGNILCFQRYEFFSIYVPLRYLKFSNREYVYPPRLCEYLKFATARMFMHVPHE